MTPIAMMAMLVGVLAYAVWAMRDVAIKRMHSDARMSALEKKLDDGIVKMFNQADGLIGSLNSRVAKLEGKKAGDVLAADQDWRK